MGLADLTNKLKAQRQHRAGQRLFQFSREARATKERLPLQPGQTFRASSLPYLCPREEVLAHKYDVTRVEFVHPRMEITWSIGKIFHDMYRDSYYGPMQEWAGAWECLRCGWDTDKAGISASPVFKKKVVSRGKLATMPGTCGGCGAPFMLPPERNEERCYGTFKEWLLVDKVIGLHGHPDGWSKRYGIERVLVDLKSHGNNGFTSRNTLRSGHDLQVWSYQHMSGDELGEVWYMNKSPWGDPLAFVREVVTPFDVNNFKLFVADPLYQVHNGIAGGPMPERVCVNAECARARECQLNDVCFDDGV